MDVHPEWHRLAIQLRKAIINSQCNWWCPPRFWVPIVTTHPRYAPAIAAFSQARKLCNDQSQHLHCVLHRLAAHINVTYHGFNAKGPVVAPAPNAHPHVHQLFRARRRADSSSHPTPPGATNTITIANDATDHIIRMAARYTLWADISLKRNDAESCQHVDLEASSNPNFTKWVKSLDEISAARLRIFRGGAAKTPTRTHHMTNNARCPYCNADLCSIRHLVTECPRLDDTRSQVLRAHHTDHGWLSQQPRVSTKTGWITMQAHRSAAKRADLQTGLCKLGIAALALGNLHTCE